MTGENSQMRRTLKSNSLGWRCPLWTSHTLPLAARTPSHIHARVTQAQTHLSVGSKTKKEACFSCQEWRETGRRMERWGGDYNLIRGRKSCQIPLKEPKCLWATGYWTPPERSSLVQKTETTGNEANNRQKKRGHNPLNYSDCKKKKKIASVFRVVRHDGVREGWTLDSSLVHIRATCTHKQQSHLRTVIQMVSLKCLINPVPIIYVYIYLSECQN